MSQPPQIVLDTTVLIDALRNRKERRGLLARLVSSGQELATSTVSIAEVIGGLRLGEEQATQSLLASVEWIPVSATIAERAITDMIVAATALESGSPVATDNSKDFQVPGLVLLQLP